MRSCPEALQNEGKANRFVLPMRGAVPPRSVEWLPRTGLKTGRDRSGLDRSAVFLSRCLKAMDPGKEAEPVRSRPRPSRDPGSAGSTKCHLVGTGTGTVLVDLETSGAGHRRDWGPAAVSLQHGTAAATCRMARAPGQRWKHPVR